MSPDRGREAVYAAEIAAFEGTSYESVVPFADLLALARGVIEAPWWPHGPIDVVPARTDATSSTTRQRGSTPPVVRLAVPQQTPATLLHELAHVLAGVGDGHSPAFRRAHADLVAWAFGDEEADWLLTAYDAMGLGPGERLWPSPPIRRTAGGPLPL